MYSFGTWWKLKISLIGFVYRIVRVLKVLWIFLSETINFQDAPQNSTIELHVYIHMYMYITPSSGHISLNFNMTFKFIIRRAEVVFWCLEWECYTFWKIDGNSCVASGSRGACSALESLSQTDKQLKQEIPSQMGGHFLTMPCAGLGVHLPVMKIHCMLLLIGFLSSYYHISPSTSKFYRLCFE